MSRTSNKEQLLNRMYRIFDVVMPYFDDDADYNGYELFNPHVGAKICSEISKLEGFYEAEKKAVDFGRSDPIIEEALDLGKQLLASRYDNQE